MKVQVYSEVITEKVVRLALFNDSNGVVLQVVDNNGKEISCGRILRITADGQLRFYSRINPNMGLKLETGCSGKIQVTKV